MLRLKTVILQNVKNGKVNSNTYVKVNLKIIS